MSIPLSESDEGLRLSVRVTPRAGRNEVGEVRDGRLQLRVTAAPEDGRANTAVAKLLAKAWRIPASAVEIVSGHSARDKTLLLRGVERSQLPPPFNV